MEAQDKYQHTFFFKNCSMGILTEVCSEYPATTVVVADTEFEVWQEGGKPRNKPRKILGASGVPVFTTFKTGFSILDAHLESPVLHLLF